MHASYTGAQDVVVTGRALIDSTCRTGPCTFTYDSTTNPTITGGIAEDDSFTAGDTVSIVGTGLAGM